MGVYKEGKNWKVQVYYKDWKGNRKRKQKRGFRTKGEAKEWERDFLQQQSQGVDIEFGNFLEIYYKDMDVRLREHTMNTKRYIIELKIRPYFEKKVLSEITVADIRAWQNELLSYKDKNGKGYAPTYLKTINCQLTAIFNYAIRYYNLPGNPCKKAGAIGKSKAVDVFAKSDEHYFDVILMDIMMPVMDGLTATKTIRSLERQEAKTIPIFAMTANAFLEDKKQSKEAGMNEHLSKPLDEKKLMNTIWKYTIGKNSNSKE